jgi:hypothetical protein
MSSILNSISSGDLELDFPEVISQKEDSILNILGKPEIEFTICPNPDIEEFNSGFGANNTLHFKLPCKKPELQTPLYKENFLREFITNEDKAEVRKSLGLFNDEDIISKSLLSAVESIPNIKEIQSAPIYQLRKGNKFFTPLTSFSSVLDAKGDTLETKINELHSMFNNYKQSVDSITSVSKESGINTLGDIKLFLQGFNKNESLLNKLDRIDHDTLRFEITGDIND